MCTHTPTAARLRRVHRRQQQVRRVGICYVGVCSARPDELTKRSTAARARRGKCLQTKRKSLTRPADSATLTLGRADYFGIAIAISQAHNADGDGAWRLAPVLLYRSCSGGVAFNGQPDKTFLLSKLSIPCCDRRPAHDSNRCQRVRIDASSPASGRLDAGSFSQHESHGRY